MKQFIQIIGLFLLGLFYLSCNSEKKEAKIKEVIQVVDFSKYQAQLSSANNLEEGKRIDSIIFEDIKTASIGKQIPKLSGMDENRNEYILDTSFARPTMVVLFSPFCGWSAADLAEELPKALSSYGNQLEVMVLLFLESRPDLNLPADFYPVQIEQLRYLYPNSYLITGREARKMNMYALPTRYYFNENGELVQLNQGKVTINRMKNEIGEFLNKTAQ